MIYQNRYDTITKCDIDERGEVRMRTLLEILNNARLRRTIAMTLAIVVVFTTTYGLVLPAITLEVDTPKESAGMLFEGSNDETDCEESTDGMPDPGETASLDDAEPSGAAEASDSEEPSGAAEVSGAAEASDGEDVAGTVAFDAMTTGKIHGEEVTMQIHVETDADTFPEGTEMTAETVTKKKILNSISEAVDDEVEQIHAVNVIFTDPNGQEVQPAEDHELSVLLASDSIPADCEPVVVQYIDRDTVEELESEQVDLSDDPRMEMDADEAVAFTTDASPVFALVETEETEQAEPAGEPTVGPAGETEETAGEPDFSPATGALDTEETGEDIAPTEEASPEGDPEQAQTSDALEVLKGVLGSLPSAWSDGAGGEAWAGEQFPELPFDGAAAQPQTGGILEEMKNVLGSMLLVCFDGESTDWVNGWEVTMKVHVEAEKDAFPRGLSWRFPP